MKLRIRLAAALLAAALLAGCSLPGAGTAPAASPAPTAAPTPPPTPEPTPTPAVTTNPLTGEETGEDYTNRRPVAVALRSGEGAAPYWGLSAADLVIEGVSEGYDPAMVAVFARAAGLGKSGPGGRGAGPGAAVRAAAQRGAGAHRQKRLRVQPAQPARVPGCGRPAHRHGGLPV